MSGRRPRRLVLAVAAVLCGSPAMPLGAQQPASDPDWPCVQQLVPEIAPQAVWAGPSLDEVAGDWRTDPEVAPLAARLASRSTPLEEAEALVADVARGLPEGERRERLTLLFRGTLAILNGERADVIDGIKRYARKQKRLAERIAEESEAIAEAGDAATAAELTAARDWDLRVFEDRLKVLTQLCEQPVLLEQRAFRLARAIRNHLGTD